MPSDDEGTFIPDDRLPEGFAQSVDDPPAHPPVPTPAATVVLMRPGVSPSPGLEVLLVRRVRSAGFVPGAYVFPGGRVDPADGGERVASRVDGLTPEEADQRLSLSDPSAPGGLAYYVSALREAFEETGLLVTPGEWPGPGPAPATLDADRQALLRDDISFAQLLTRHDLRIDGNALEYIAHWITPVAEPRRYDTRFFAARVSRDQEVSLHRAELSDAIWTTPGEALRRRESGELPMVFPTIRTLQDLSAFERPEEVLDFYHSREIPTIEPRLVRRDGGVSIEE